MRQVFWVAVHFKMNCYSFPREGEEIQSSSETGLRGSCSFQNELEFPAYRYREGGEIRSSSETGLRGISSFRNQLLFLGDG
jgi:hypothetical protein